MSVVPDFVPNYPRLLKGNRHSCAVFPRLAVDNAPSLERAGNFGSNAMDLYVFLLLQRLVETDLFGQLLEWAVEKDICLLLAMKL